MIIKRFKCSFLFILILMLSYTGSAQITGRLVDQESNAALEYATATLYNQDGSINTGVITDKNGKFVLAGLPSGNYFLEMSFMGYESLKIDNIVLENKETFIDLGLLRLSIHTNQLSKVYLETEVPSVLHQIDREIFEASKFQNSVGGSAIDLIKNLPSITVTANGVLRARGSNSFSVLINGKPTQGDASIILSQLPANAVKSVELITAPSAKYDPEGTAGIINILTKSLSIEGDYAQVNIRGGFPPIQDYKTKEYPQRFGIDAIYNTRTDKLNISLGASYQRNDISGRRVGGLEIFDMANDVHRFLPSEGERSFDKVSYDTRLSVDYTPNYNNEFSLGVYAGRKQKDRLADIYYDNYSISPVGSQNRENEFAYYNHNLRTRLGDFTLASFDYTHLFENTSKLSASVLYEYTFLGGPTENDNVSDIDYSTIYQQEKNTNNNPLNGIRFNLDYSWKPTVFTSIETGYQYRHLDHMGEFKYERKNVEQGAFDFSLVPEFSSDIRLRRSIHSTYFQFSSKKENWNYIAGIRAESMDREYQEELVSDTQKRSPYDYGYFKLFPSLLLQYSLNDKTKLKAAYSKRVQRTTTFKMNSFAEREHSEVYEQGDNTLKPEFIDLFELGINKKFKGGNTVFANTYYRQTKNVINRVNTLAYESNGEVIDHILNRVYSNVGKSNTIGLEVGATLKSSENFTTFIGANLYSYAVDGVMGFEHRDGKTRTYDIDSKSANYSLSINSTYDFWQNASLQFTLNYLSDRVTAMGEDSRFYTPNLILRKFFLQDNLAATLQWQNMDLGILNTNEQRITTSRANEFYTTTNYIYEVDMISLNLTYTFNKLRNKSKFIESEFGKKEF